MLALFAAACAALGECPVAPSGYSLLAGHCIGPDPHSRNCATPPQGQLSHGYCAGNQSACVPIIARYCAGNATCRSFAIYTDGQGCTQLAASTTRYQLFAADEASATANEQWTAYARPAAPTPPTPPTPPMPQPTPPPMPPPTPPPPCASDLDCSLNGVCDVGTGLCACDAPWHGAACALLRRGAARVAGGGIYGYAPNVTSWGGNAIADANGTWHLYASEMAGRDCGLHVWGSQSTVVHATAPSVEGPYMKQATVVGAEAHNPQAIVVGGEWFIFHIGIGDRGGAPNDCNETGARAAPSARSSGGGSTLHVAASPYGPFVPVTGGGAPSGCNNPSPVVHPNGTLFLFCTWSLRASRSGSARGPWGPPMAVQPPSSAARHPEDPFLWIDARGNYHVLYHTWSALPYPSMAISGHGFSVDGANWTFSPTEPYSNVIVQSDGTVQRFATLERPKLLFTDAASPHTPTHLINGASSLWLNGTDPCAPCGHCSHCKQTLGIDWTYTLMTPLN